MGSSSSRGVYVYVYPSNPLTRTPRCRTQTFLRFINHVLQPHNLHVESLSDSWSTGASP